MLHNTPFPIITNGKRIENNGKPQKLLLDTGTEDSQDKIYQKMRFSGQDKNEKW